MSDQSPVKPYPAIARVCIPIVLVAMLIAAACFTFGNVKGLLKPRTDPFESAYTQLKGSSDLHRKVVDHYWPCIKTRGLWPGRLEVRTYDCLSMTMLEMDKLGLPKAELFTVEQDIRKAERKVADWLIENI